MTRHADERWHLYTDGSAITTSFVKGRDRWPGGWAVVVEHGSDGFTLRGRETFTSSTKMELRAAIEALRVVPLDQTAVLHFDCTAIMLAHQRWKEGTVYDYTGGDSALWKELAREFSRVDVVLEMIGRGGNDIHNRAHVMAQGEARAAAGAMPPHAVPLPSHDVKYIRKLRRQIERDKRERERHLRENADHTLAGRTVLSMMSYKELKHLRHTMGLQHQAGCEPGLCLSTCPVWQYFGMAVG